MASLTIDDLDDAALERLEAGHVHVFDVHEVEQGIGGHLFDRLHDRIRVFGERHYCIGELCFCFGYSSRRRSSGSRFL